MLLSIIIFFTFAKIFSGKDLTDCNPNTEIIFFYSIKNAKAVRLRCSVESFTLQLRLSIFS